MADRRLGSWSGRCGLPLSWVIIKNASKSLVFLVGRLGEFGKNRDSIYLCFGYCRGMNPKLEPYSRSGGGTPGSSKRCERSTWVATESRGHGLRASTS